MVTDQFSQNEIDAEPKGLRIIKLVVFTSVAMIMLLWTVFLLIPGTHPSGFVRGAYFFTGVCLIGFLGARRTSEFFSWIWIFFR